MRGERLENQRNTETRKLQRETMRNVGRKVLSAGTIEHATRVRNVQMEDFQGVHPPAKLTADRSYLDRVEQAMDTRNEKGAAMLFEQMFLDGITVGAWLGNVEVTEAGMQTSFTVDARGTTKYDDISHKVDAFATLDFKEPIIDEDYDTETSQVVLGFDVTINADREKIYEKLTKAYNDRIKLPFGFSHLDYYENRRERKMVAMLPRYVIGVSGYDVRAIEESTRVRPEVGTLVFDLNSGQNLINRFKVLSEIRAENELYQAMLPDDLDSAMLQEANASLYAIDQCLHGALLKCTSAIMKSKCLPRAVLERVETATRSGREVKARGIIEEYLLQRSQKAFLEEASQVGQNGRPRCGDKDTFVQIMECCRNLTDAAYAGKLDAYRGVKEHNQGIVLANSKGTEENEAEFSIA